MDTRQENDVAKGFKMGIGFILACIVAAAVLCVVGVLFGLYLQSGDLKPSASHADSAEQSWQEFAARYPDIASCPSSPGPDGYPRADYRFYDKLRQADGQSFGVLVLGCPDSEYYIYLYRWDAASNTWVDSPRSAPPDMPDGMQDVDVPATSIRWNVPEAVIEDWCAEADDFMHSDQR